MVQRYRHEVRLISDHIFKLDGYRIELGNAVARVTPTAPLALRRALAGMEETADLLLTAVRVLTHRAESLR